MTFEDVKDAVESLKEEAEKQAENYKELTSFANGKFIAYDTVLELFKLMNDERTSN